MTTAVIASLVGPDVVALEATPSMDDVDRLYPEETARIGKAIEKRQSEFATARVLARRGLSALGLPEQCLAPNADHSPRWPDAIVGSITHTAGYCAIAVARSTDVAGIGIDAERGPLKLKLLSRICTEAEKSWLGQRAPLERGMLAKVVFSAKEAFYKCQYPLTETFIGFRDVQVTLDEQARTFRVHWNDKALVDISLDKIEGRYGFFDDLIVTTARYS